jgi:glycosyltransferase involved in cell wall biosynthesis
MQEKIEISVLLITYKRLALLKESLQSILLAKNEVIKEILILVNGLDTETSSYLEELSNTNNIIKVYGTSKMCRGQARNILIKKAGGEYISFFDDDIVLPKNYFENLSNKILLFKDVIVFGGGEVLDLNKMSFFQRGLSFALSSFWGAGPFTSRCSFAFKDRPARFEDFILSNLTVKREFLNNNNIFFKGNLISAEENLLLSEIAALNGKMLMSEDLNLYHEKRKSFIMLAKQIFKSGAGRLQISLLSFKAFNCFTLLPLGGLLLSLLLLFFLPKLFICLSTVYILINVFFVLKGFWLYKKIKIAIILFFIFPVIHLSYALGYLFGFFSFFKIKVDNK